VIDPAVNGTPARPVPGIDNGFVAGYRIRFDEAGPDGFVRTAGLLRYAQDVAWRHSEDLGFDREWYVARGRWWVVRSLELRVVEPVRMGQTVRVATAVIGHRRIWARRLAEARTADDRLAVAIVADWVLLDDRGRLVRIPEDFGLSFANPELAGEILKVAPSPTKQPSSRIQVRVRPQDLDPMDHVNNAVYVDWLEEALLESGHADGARGAPRTARIEYLASAAPDDEVEIALWLDGPRWRARIARVADDGELVRAEGEGPTLASAAGAGDRPPR
jgi:acyl-CoA thioesterase FadM